MPIKDFTIEAMLEGDVQGLINQDPLPDPLLLEFYNNLSKRIIYWNSDISDDIVDMSMHIIKWNQKDSDIPVPERIPIRIFINSPGGCLNSVMNFINVIQISRTPVWTIGMGKALSSGCLLLMSGHKGNRYIFEDTEALIHNGSTGMFGDTGKVIDSLERTKKLEERVKMYVLENTKISSKLYDKNYRKDWWIANQDIIDCGIADKIIESLDEIY